MLMTQPQWPNWAKIKRKEAIIHTELVGQMSCINWKAVFCFVLFFYFCCRDLFLISVGVLNNKSKKKITLLIGN